MKKRPKYSTITYTEDGYTIEISSLAEIESEKRSEFICRKAVQANGLDIRYVPEEILNEDLCIEAVKENPKALYYIENQTDEICIEALKRNGNVIKAVTIDITEEMELCAVKSKPYIILSLEEPSELACEAALIRMPILIRFMKNPSNKIIEVAIKCEGTYIKYIPHELRTEELCVMATKSNPLSLYYMSEEEQTDDVIITALNMNPLCIEYVKNQIPAYCAYAVYLDIHALSHIRELCSEFICKMIMVRPSIFNILPNDMVDEYVVNTWSKMKEMRSREEDDYDNKIW